MRDVMLIIHFIGLAMGIGTSFGFMFLGMAASKMEKNEAQKFTLNAMAMSRMGHIGLTLLVISGLGMLHPYFGMLSTNYFLIAKLVLVLVLGALIGIMSSTAKKAKRGDAEMHLKKIAGLGKLAMLVSVIIVILAVSVFH